MSISQTTTTSRTRGLLALGALALPTLLVAIDISVLAVALPTMGRELHASATELLWMTDSYNFLVAGAMLTTGAVADRIGRRRMIMICAATFAVASGVGAFATTPLLVIIARAVMGLAGSAIFPASMALLAGLFTEEKARIQAMGAMMTVFLGGMAGSALGLLAGYYRGPTGTVILRLTDLLLALPGILLALTIVAATGPSLENLIVAVGISSMPAYVRVINGAVLDVSTRTFIEASRASGAADLRILGRHVVPNILAPVIVLSTLGLGNALLIAATLSFLGLGAQPPTPEWGAMLADSYKYFASGAWWVFFFPGAAIMLSVLGFNLVGDGLRDALDPRLRSD